MARDNWLFGVGPDNFLTHYRAYMLPEAWREPNISHPHNLLLDAWVSLGRDWPGGAGGGAGAVLAGLGSDSAGWSPADSDLAGLRAGRAR